MKLNLLYDAICDVKYCNDLLQKNVHLVLKKHFFSLNNLLEISKGVLIPFLKRCN